MFDVPSKPLLSQELAMLIQGPLWHLDEAALLISCLEESGFERDFYLHKLSQLALEFERRLPSKRDLGLVVETFVQFMAVENGFCGAEENYFDLDNVYLHRVMERRRGMPLSLSIIYIEVARRVGLPLLGIGLPGHFLIQLEGRSDRFIDPFYGGEGLNTEGCRQRFHQIYGKDAHFDARFLKPVPKLQMLARFINNLKGIYMRKPDPYKTIRLIDLYLVLHPQASVELLERGLLYRQLECYNPALRDLESYLNTLPDDDSTLEQRQKILQEIAALKRLTLNFH